MSTIVHACKPLAKLVSYLNGGIVPSAFTLGDLIVVFNGYPPSEEKMVLDHEEVHVRQAQWYEPFWCPIPPLRKYIGWARYWKEYLKEHNKHGYWDNHFEREARILSGQEKIDNIGVV